MRSAIGKSQLVSRPNSDLVSRPNPELVSRPDARNVGRFHRVKGPSARQIFENLPGKAQESYLHALYTMAHTMRARFGQNIEVWLEANSDSLRMVYRAPTKDVFNFAYGVPTRPARPGELAGGGDDRRFYVHGSSPHLAKMQRPKS